MTKEYIEREALLGMVQPDDPSDETAAITIATAKKLIRSLAYRCPAADVAPVVRCKDCRWRGREDCAMFYRCDCGEQHTWETDNDFCSYGEQ